MSRTLTAPSRWPSMRGWPRSFAQRPFPSMMIATCRGSCDGSNGGGGGDPLSIGIAREYHAGLSVATDGVLPYADSAMGIFARLGSLLKSNINDLISKAEDPE